MTLAGLPLILGIAAKLPCPVVPNSYRLVTVSLRKCRSFPIVAFKVPSSKFHSPLTGFGVGIPCGEGPPSAAMSSSDIRPWRICRLLIQHSVRSLSSSLKSSISGGSEKRESRASPLLVTVVVCLKPLTYLPTTRGVAAKSTANTTRAHSLRGCVCAGSMPAYAEQQFLPQLNEDARQNMSASPGVPRLVVRNTAPNWTAPLW